jgi:hypothetical protein
MKWKKNGTKDFERLDPGISTLQMIESLTFSTSTVHYISQVIQLQHTDHE